MLQDHPTESCGVVVALLSTAVVKVQHGFRKPLVLSHSSLPLLTRESYGWTRKHACSPLDAVLPYLIQRAGLYLALVFYELDGAVLKSKLTRTSTFLNSSS